MEIKISIKEKVEACLRKNEGAWSIVWGEDSCTTFDENKRRTRQTLWEECTDANPKLSLNDT